MKVTAYDRWRRALEAASHGARGEILSKFARALRRGGLPELARIVRNLCHASGTPEARVFSGEDEYSRWIARNDTLTSLRRFEMEVVASEFPKRPLISILLPTYNTPAEWLCDAVESVRSQVYGNWELCIADDASSAPHVRRMLLDYTEIDSRIRFMIREHNGHICATTNDALKLAHGEWVALLDHDDVLSADALFWAAKAINDRPDVSMIYSDEDKIDESGRRFGAYFKPDWNPDLFLAQNVFSHFGMFKTELVRAVGGFRAGFEGSQDHDLALRCSERLQRNQIAHVPRVLYHWRAHAESTSLSHQVKPYAQTAGVKAVQEHLARQRVAAECESTPAGYRIRYAFPNGPPAVAVLVTGGRKSRNAGMQCAKALIERTNYPKMRVFVASDEEVPHGLSAQVVAVGAGEAEGFQRALAQIAAEGIDFVCIYDAGLRPRDSDWLREMTSHAARPGVGAVGAKITSGDRIESAGIVLLPGDPLRPVDVHKSSLAASPGYFGRARLAHHSTAVRSACMVISTEMLRTAGIDPTRGDHDVGVAICQLVRSRGLDVVCTPHAELEATRRLLPLPARFAWPALEQGDPNYNPNLFSGAADFSLAWPPRHAPFDAE